MAEPPTHDPPAASRLPPDERAVIFNMVWTGQVFDDLQLFTHSLLLHTRARFRFVANACPPDQIRNMERFASDHADRVVGVEVVSTDRMVRHGDALDDVRRRHDDGDFFAFMDPDILARAPFLHTLLTELAGAAAVTSGREVWSDHNVRPAEHPGVNGEYFYDQDGFVFGSPHLAVYRRAALDQTLDRWGVGFSSAGNESAEVRRRLEEMGRSFLVYDTAKIVNILLQGDGHLLVHRDDTHLVHIGGMSHYLAPPQPVPGPDGTITPQWGEEANWREWAGMADRYDLAQYASLVLRAVAAGDAPPAPDTVADHLADRATIVHESLIELGRLVGPVRVAEGAT